MTAQLIDFHTARVKRDAKYAALVEQIEQTAYILRPYASMDELPNITPRGQLALRALLGLITRLAYYNEKPNDRP